MARKPHVLTPARLAHLQKLNKPLAQRFAELATRRTETGCLEWTGARDTAGYGRIGRNPSRGATHVALELAGRPRPSPEMCALHRCDNPACVEAEHLWWGTHGENWKDCHAKGRTNMDGLAIGQKYGPGARHYRGRG